MSNMYETTFVQKIWMQVLFINMKNASSYNGKYYFSSPARSNDHL